MSYFRGGCTFRFFLGTSHVILSSLSAFCTRAAISEEISTDFDTNCSLDFELPFAVDFLPAPVLEGISANFCGKFNLDFELPFAVDMSPPSVSETTSGYVSDGSTDVTDELISQISC